MIASGFSLRGLSDVMTMRSLRRAATAPISGRFVRSRIAAAAEHRNHAATSQRPRLSPVDF